MKEYIDALRKHITDNPPKFGGADSVLTLLYEVYSDVNRMDGIQVKADFNALYQTMNGMILQEMDRILDPVCTLCRDHERVGFVEGIKIGIMLNQELTTD